MAVSGNIGNLGALSFALTVTDETGAGIASVKGNLRSVEASAAAANQSMRGIARTAGMWGGIWGTVTSQVSNALIGVAYDFINFNEQVLASAMDYAGRYEQSVIGFTMMLGGSKTEALGYLQEIRNFAMKTPFEFFETQDIARFMLTLQWTKKETMDLLTEIGDTVSATGKGTQGFQQLALALSQVKMRGTLGGNDVYQLINANIPIWDIMAKKYDKSIKDVRKMSEQGEISAKDAIDAVREYMRTHYAGMMEEQNKTFKGQMAQMNDITQQFLIGMGTNIIRYVTPALRVVTSVMIGQYLPLLNKATDMWGRMSGSLMAFWQIINHVITIDGIKKALQGFFDWWWSIFATFWNYIYNMAKAAMLIGDALLDALGGVFDFIFGALGGAGSFIQAVLNGFVRFSEVVLVVASILTNTQVATGQKIRDILTWILSSFIEFGQKLLKLWAQIMKFLISLFITGLENFINGGIDVLNRGLALIHKGVIAWTVILRTNLLHNLTNIGKAAAEGLINGLGGKMASGIGKVAGMLNNWFSALPDWAKKYLGGFGIGGINWEGFSSGAETMKEDLSDWQISHVDMSGIEAGATGTVDKMLDSLMGMIDGLQSKYGMDVSLDDMATKYGVNLGEFQQIIDSLKAIGIDLGGEGEWEDFGEDPEKLKKAIKNLADKIDGKDMSMKLVLNFDVDVENAGSQEELEKMSKKLQDDVVAVLVKKGVIPAA